MHIKRKLNEMKENPIKNKKQMNNIKFEEIFYNFNKNNKLKGVPFVL